MEKRFHIKRFWFLRHRLVPTAKFTSFHLILASSPPPPFPWPTPKHTHFHHHSHAPLLIQHSKITSFVPKHISNIIESSEGEAQPPSLLLPRHSQRPKALRIRLAQAHMTNTSATLLGGNTVFSTVREMPIVGGSGAFRFARGYGLAKTQTFDVKTGDAAVEYYVYVFYY
ncbi:hypothetical protein JHK82_053679 [Glycine max]|nr:hypothetical protein JHK86_053528 [Glycine max]KAG4927988.1 hypothetical protein JHK85_054474 [Glycine max]KAG5083512.1 hypothetical protein JHK84_053550 [Glycine max]KAG5086282.1 hypothetical protein JHK82_053679 [Glycine max]